MVGDLQKNKETTLDHANLAAGADAMLDGRFDAGNHLYPLRVQYEDTDAGGIVYHAQYLAFAERARSAWFRCLGIDQPAMLADDGLALWYAGSRLIFIFLLVLVILLMLKAACCGLAAHH